MNKKVISFGKLFIALVAVVFLFSPRSAFADTTASLLPVSDGSYVQWTPSTGTSHFALVNEASCNGTSNYNSTSSVGNRDSYGIDLSSIPNGATITQIVLTPCASRNANGGTSPVMNLFYRLNGVDSAVAGAYSLSNTTTPTVLGSTTFSGLVNIKGSTTTLQIGAVLSSGNKGARLSQLSGVVTYTPLATPSGLVAVALSTESAKLTWTDNATTEFGYKVERSTDGVNFSQIASTGQNSTGYVDKNVIGTFYYRVRATNSGGDSDYSNTANTTVTLNAPTSLTGTAGTGSASLNWTDSSLNESGFKVERGTDGVNFSQVGTMSANMPFFNDATVSAGLVYYRVKAYKGTIDSTYSNIFSLTVL